jgi:hypothetical protein
MSKYGIDYYGVSYYGPNNLFLFDASPFKAIASNYNKIFLKWTDPVGTSTNNWSKLRLVRNSYGYPVDAWDGITLLEVDNGNDPTNYTDTNLADNQFYYYSIFVLENVQFTWLRAGNASGLSVKKQENTSLGVYELVPNIYKITQPYALSENYENNDLLNFTNLFDFQVDHAKSFVDLLVSRYDTQKVSATLIPTMMEQFGVTYEPGLGLQQSRILLRNAIHISQEKGSLLGLKDFVKAFTNYALPDPKISTPNPSNQGIVVGHNLMLDYNDSSFEESEGSWYESNFNTYITQVGKAKIKDVSITSNTATLNMIGTSLHYNIVQAGISGGIATLKTDVPNGINFNDYIKVSGVGSDFNGSFRVIASDEYTFSFFTITPTYTLASAPVTGGTVDTYLHKYIAGSSFYIDESPLQLFNNKTSASYTATSVTPTSISFSITNPNIPVTSLYNKAVNDYAYVIPGPLPYLEITSPNNFPNKTNGVLSVSNVGQSTSDLQFVSGANSLVELDPINAGIPVTAGLHYTWSYYSAAITTPRSMYAQIDWYDRLGNYIVTSSGDSFTNNVGVFDTRPFISDVAPTDAYYAIVSIYIFSVDPGEFHYIDACQFEQSEEPTEFDEARQLHITLRATRINELINPHFATPTTPWVTTGGTTTTDTVSPEPGVDTYVIKSASISSNVATITLDRIHIIPNAVYVVISGVGAPFDGQHLVDTTGNYTITFSLTHSNETLSSLNGTAYIAGNGYQVTATATNVSISSWNGSTHSQLMGIYYPDTSYTFSVYGRTQTGTQQAYVTIEWYDILYNHLSTSTGSTGTLRSSWSRLSVTDTAPSDAAFAAVSIKYTTTVGNVSYFDSALFENVAFVLEYFDGSKGPANPVDLFWEGGVVNGARSHLYKNRIAVENRLVQGTLQKYLPLGSTFALYLAQPNT